MPKAEPKTRRTDASVAKFLAGIEEPERRAECRALAKLMEEATGAKPAMWGASIVGFGRYHYVYESGREGDWFLAGFSPRKKNLTVYLAPGLEAETELRAGLGKHSIGKGCLYFDRLADLHLPTLRRLVQRTAARLRNADRSAK